MATPPNVLLIVVDACRPDYLSPYANGDGGDRGDGGGESDASGGGGAGDARTPAIGSLAEEGTVFRRAISAAPWTLPSVTSVLTGLRPAEHGATSRQFAMRRGETVTRQLSESGYECVHLSPKTWIGDWLPQGRGFDRVEEFTGPRHRYFDGGADVRRLSAGVERGPEWYATVLQRALRSDSPLLSLANVAAYRASEATGDVWLDDLRASERAAERADDVFDDLGDDRPFFAYAHLMDPHLPFYVPEEFRSDVRPPGCADYEAEIEWMQELMDDLWAIRLGDRRLDDDERTFLRARYADEVRYADHAVGRILDSLERHGHADDTVVIFASDHGEHLGEAYDAFSDEDDERADGEYGDRTPLDHQTSIRFPLVRVPLIVRRPDADERSSSSPRSASPREDADGGGSDALVQTHDIAATIRDVAGLDHDPARSLLDHDGREVAAAEYAGVVPSHPPEGVRDERLFVPRRTAIAGDWKLDAVGDRLRARRIDWDANATDGAALDAVPDDRLAALGRGLAEVGVDPALLAGELTDAAERAFDPQDFGDGRASGGSERRDADAAADERGEMPTDVEENLRDLGYL